MSGVWREPDEESTDLYPGLVVHDGRVSGSITIGRSRLPLWAIIHTAVHEGWEQVEWQYGPIASDFSVDALSEFLYNLLELRGEFGRLLLILAAAVRWEQDAEDDKDEPIPPAWWETEETRDKVRDQLKRCLECLTARESSEST